jgi:two-component system, OmpR family, phosphate regulon sensor histidine kinase PhoR
MMTLTIRFLLKQSERLVTGWFPGTDAMKKIMKSALLTGMLAMALAAAALIVMMAILEISVVRKNLRAILDTASAWTAESTENLNDLSSKIARSASPLRVTFLLPEGIALADSHENALEIGDLSAEPDIRNAAENGTGEWFSLAGSRGIPTLYATRILSGKLFLRLQYPLSDILGMLWLYIPVLVLLFAALAHIQHRSSAILSRRIVRQLEQVRDILDGAVHREGLPADVFFPELRPVMDNICRLIDRMRYDLKEIQKTRDMRRDFIANASHALKNPLTSILGFAEMLSEESARTHEKRGQYLQFITNESRRMISVIDGILQLEKPVSGQGEKKGPVNMHELALDVAASLEPQCRDRNITIDVAGNMDMTATERDMRELLHNLIGNAVRYGINGGWVNVLLEPEALAVSDNGIGIAKDQVSRIFEPFYRVDSTQRPGAGGTGLGLAIVSRIVDKYGGSIRVDSSPGNGSSFIVRFVRNV